MTTDLISLEKLVEEVETLSDQLTDRLNVYRQLTHAAIHELKDLRKSLPVWARMITLENFRRRLADGESADWIMKTPQPDDMPGIVDSKSEKSRRVRKTRKRRR